MKHSKKVIFPAIACGIFILFSYLLLFKNSPTKTQAQTSNTDWPMFMHDPQHTGNTNATFTPINGTANCQLTSNQDISPCMQIKWKKNFTDFPNGLAQPVIVGNTIYQAVMDGKLYAFDTETGTQRWVFDAGSPIAVTPAVFENRIYFGDFSGKIYGLNISDKSAVFTPIQTGGPIYSSPVVVKEATTTKVFIGSNDGKLYGINGVNGQTLFAFDTGGSAIISNPAYINSKVFFAAENMNAYAISSSGSQVWVRKLQGESNRNNHPVIVANTNLVLFHTLPRYGNTGMGIKDRFRTYDLVGGHVGPSETTLGPLMLDYQTKIGQNEQSKSMFLFDINTGTEITSFTAEGQPLTMIALNLWYGNGQNYPLVVNQNDLIFPSFGAYIKLDTTTKQFSVLIDNQFVRGDEYTGVILADNYLYGGFKANIARIRITDKSRQQLHGCKDCGDPPTYGVFDGPSSNTHWTGYTGDGQTDIGSYFIPGSTRAFWSANGWLYAF